jgi:hypothetical protein
MGPVRKSLVLPLLYLFNFLIVVIIVAALDFLYRVGTVPADQGVAVINLIPFSLRQAIPAACICALLFTFLRMINKPGSHFLSLLLLLATASAVLIFSLIGISLIEGDRPVGSTSASEVFKPGVIHVYGAGMLYVEEVEGDSLERVVHIMAPESAETPKIRYAPRARARLNGDTVSVDMGSEYGELEFSAKKIREGFFRPVAPLAFFLSDYAILTDDLGNLQKEGGWEFYLLCVALVFFVLGTNLWMRITRWPLFNFLLVVLIIRGIFFLYAYVRVNLANELVKLFEESILAKNLPAFGFLLLGLIFILAEALFVPYDRLSEDRGS